MKSMNTHLLAVQFPHMIMTRPAVSWKSTYILIAVVLFPLIPMMIVVVTLRIILMTSHVGAIM
jgi:hypothetical protein